LALFNENNVPAEQSEQKHYLELVTGFKQADGDSSSLLLIGGLAASIAMGWRLV